MTNARCSNARRSSSGLAFSTNKSADFADFKNRSRHRRRRMEALTAVAACRASAGLKPAYATKSSEAHAIGVPGTNVMPVSVPTPIINPASCALTSTWSHATSDHILGIPSNWMSVMPVASCPSKVRGRPAERSEPAPSIRATTFGLCRNITRSIRRRGTLPCSMVSTPASSPDAARAGALRVRATTLPY